MRGVRRFDSRLVKSEKQTHRELANRVHGITPRSQQNSLPRLSLEHSCLSTLVADTSTPIKRQTIDDQSTCLTDNWFRFTMKTDLGSVW